MTYCASCPRIAARLRDVTYPHNQLYWATVIFLTLFEMVIVILNCILYANEAEEKGMLIALSIFHLILDAASLVIAKGIYKYLQKTRMSVASPQRLHVKKVPRPQSCVLHFITSFPSEWIRFYCCVMIMKSFEEAYSTTMMIQVFMGPIMSFYTLRQMSFNVLIWVNSNDCQYIINTLFTHLAITANFFWVIIMLTVATLSREWTDHNATSAVTLAVGSASGQLGTLIFVLVQGFRKKSSKTNTSVVPYAKKSKMKSKKLSTKDSSARIHRMKKFIQPSMLDTILEQEKNMGLDPLEEQLLVAEITSLLKNHPKEWVAIPEIKMHLKIKLQFYDWSEYGYMDDKQFFVDHKDIYGMKYSEYKPRELLVNLRI